MTESNYTFPEWRFVHYKSDGTKETENRWKYLTDMSDDLGQYVPPGWVFENPVTIEVIRTASETEVRRSMEREMN